MSFSWLKQLCDTEKIPENGTHFHANYTDFYNQ